MTHPTRLLAIASAVRRQILNAGFARTSCIETSAVLVEVLSHYGVASVPVVTSAIAVSPAMQRLLDRGLDAQVALAEFGHLADVYSIGCGLPESGFPVGSSDESSNRYIGHVCCLVGTGKDRRLLLDATVDQMARPAHGIVLSSPVLFPVSGDYAGGRRNDDLVLSYDLYLQIPPPVPKRGKMLSRMARGIVANFGSGRSGRDPDVSADHGFYEGQNYAHR